MEFSLLEDLTEAGADVVGPVSTVDEALQIVTSESFDLAVLDINVRGEMSFPVADALLARNVPLIFLHRLRRGHHTGSVAAAATARQAI